MQEMQETQFWSLSREDPPWGKKWQPTPVFLPGKSHGQRSMAGYSLVHWIAKSWTQLRMHVHYFRVECIANTFF